MSGAGAWAYAKAEACSRDLAETVTQDLSVVRAQDRAGAVTQVLSEPRAYGLAEA